MQAPENQTGFGVGSSALPQTRDRMGLEQNQARLSNDLGVGYRATPRLRSPLMSSQGNSEATQ